MYKSKNILKTFLLVGIGALFLPTLVFAAPIVQNPENPLTHVSKSISAGMYVPTDLVPLENIGAPGEFIRQIAFHDLQTMMTDMQQQGVPVKINSAYRSFNQQTELFNQTVAANSTNTDTVAPPGFSEHQLGLAIDFGVVKTATSDPAKGFANSPQYIWLQQNAYKYGFGISYPAGAQAITGYAYEPWHWRYVGTVSAAEWKQSGNLFRQYLNLKPQVYIPSSLINTVVKSENDPTVYYISANGTKRGFISAPIFLSYGLKWENILIVQPSQLSGLPETRVVKLSGDPTVYKLNADKTRQAFASGAAFLNLGYTWTDIVEVNATELGAYTQNQIYN